MSSARIIVNLLSAAVLVQAWLYVRLAPYTKVEESFTLQAVHDILSFGVGRHGRAKFDHIAFPGAVPRSFFGPLLLSIVSYPVLLFFKQLGCIRNSAEAGLYVRLTLATAHSVTLLLFTSLCLSTASQKGKLAVARVGTIRTFFLLITLTQFNNLFWAGRTTPNGVIAPVVNVALALLLTQPSSFQSRWLAMVTAISLLVWSTIVARSELVGLLLPGMTLALVEGLSEGQGGKSISSNNKLTKWKSIIRLVLVAAAFGLFAIASSVLLDTYMWGRSYAMRKGGLLWPEFEAIVFNVLEGKSADWGVSPPHTYYTLHIPKLLSFPALFVPTALPELLSGHGTHVVILRRAAVLALSHITVLSVLGHKEARFVSYTVPLLNLVAATGAAKLWQLKGSHSSSMASRCFVLLVLLSSAILTVISTIASMCNYPGGEALAALHRLKGHENASIHIDVLPAMTGVSLFQSVLDHGRSRQGAFGLDALPDVFPSSNEGVRWTYDKTEGVYAHASKESSLIETFTYIVSESGTCHGLPNFQLMRNDQDEAITFAQFAGIRLTTLNDWMMRFKELLSHPEIPSITQLATLSPLHINRQDAVWICERRKYDVIRGS